jgi:RNA polymerase sigma factor for flagellar operon FliA
VTRSRAIQNELPTEVPKAPSRRTATASELREWMWLVEKIVGGMLKRVPPNVLKDDLLAAGTCGLLKALSKPGERGKAFESYARLRIQGAILDELRTEDWLSRKARERENALDRRFLVPLDELPEHCAELTAPFRDLEERIDEHARLRTILGAVSTLPRRERRVIRMIYVDGLYLKDVARRLGLSEARVSQIHVRAVTALRAQLAA